jgi:PPOX class probable F420-dependent enzyme
MTLPEHVRELFEGPYGSESLGPNFVTLATLDPDGQPQLSVVWAKLDGDDLLVSTIKGRRKYANLLRDPRASALAYPADDAYRYAEIRGKVTITEDPRAELINELALKYTGQPFGDRPGERRVIVRLSPDRVFLYQD